MSSKLKVKMTDSSIKSLYKRCIEMEKKGYDYLMPITNIREFSPNTKYKRTKKTPYNTNPIRGNVKYMTIMHKVN